MASKTKNRTIHYKRVVFSDPSVTLQSVLSAALKNKVKNADDRREQFTEDENIFRLINKNTTYSKTLFGQFIVFEPGRGQPLLKVEHNKQFYPIATSTPGENEAFADEVFYFGVRDNDLVCMQTRSIRARELETHLSWLLTTCTELVGDEVTLEIINQPNAQIVKRMAGRSVRAIKLGTQIFTDIAKSPPPKKVAKKKRFQFIGKAGDILRAAMGVDKFNQLRFEEDLDEANLQVSVEVKFSRKTTEEGQRALDSVASTFRHIEGVDYEMTLKGGGNIKGDDMKISKQASVLFLDSGLIDENYLYKQMHEFLIETLTGQVEL